MGYVIITGASAGLGREFAKRFARDGYDLILVARREDRMNELKAKIKKKYPDRYVDVMVVDLSDIEACKTFAHDIGHLPISVWVNNAGFGDCGPFTETSLDKELQMIDVNVKALHILTKLAITALDGNGYILNVCSSAGLIPGGPYMATYYATKAYATSLTLGVAQELKEQGSRVKISALCPGPVQTEFNDVANVEFSLKGISPKYCVRYAVNQMYRGKTIIVPTLRMKLATIGGKLIPRLTYVRLAGNQQKKKINLK